MTYRILCDEHVRKQTSVQLRKLGHDVERIVDVPVLGVSSDDGEIMAYASQTDRLILTADDDFLSDPDHQAGVLFLPNERLRPRTIATIVDVVADALDQDDIHDRVYLTTEWL